MTNILDKATIRLVVEAGIAATNHGLLKEAESILLALPYWIPDLSTRRTVAAILLFGLRRPAEALAQLEDEQSDEACALRCLIQDMITTTNATEGSATAQLLTQLAADRSTTKWTSKP